MTSVALSLILLAAAGLQQPEPKPVPADSVEIDARGCLKGRVFTATAPPEDEGVRRGPDVTGRRFRVSGARDLMDLVKKHDGQLVQIVAIIRKDALADEGVGMKVGKGTRVVIGAPGGDPTRMNTRAAPAPVPTMDLIAIRPLSSRCPLS